MSSAMRNFMEAYHAVHNPDAKEEFYSKKDELSEMDFSLINQDELDEIAEEALEEMFSEGFTVSEAELVFEDIITEAKVSYGHDTESPRAQKVKAMKSSLKGAIDKVKGKASKGAVKGYQAYRDAKTSAADKARRTAQTAKNMGAQTARKASDAKAKIKSGLKGMIGKAAERVASGASNIAKRMSEGVRDMDPEKGTKERKARLEKKRGMKMDDHPQYKKEEVEQVDEADSLAAMQARREKRLARQRKQMGTSSTGQDFGHDYGISSAERKKRQQAEFDKFVGKKTKKEEVEHVDEVYKGKHGQSDKEYADSRSQGGKMVSGDSKMSGAEYTHGRRVKAANPGMQPDVGGKTKPKSQGKMDKGTRADMMYRKANMKKSMKEAWADAYKAVYEVEEEAKPDYLDFDKDGNKKESMKKALKDKKKGNPNENGNGGDMGEQFKFSEAELQRIQKIVDSW